MKRKSHDVLIRALPRIRHEIPDVLYAIVGDGEERRALEQLADDLNLTGCVVFHGELPDADLVAAVQQCDLFVLPNREIAGEVEGFGIVLLEAQACAVSVIAGDTGGTGEAVNAPHSGRIVRPDDTDELVGTLVELLSAESLRRRMGQAGRDWVVSRFDWTRLASEAADVFRDACATRTVRPPSRAAASFSV